MRPSELGKKMIVTICALLLIFLAAAVLYYRSLAFLPFAFGAVLGSSVSIAKVLILERNVDRALEMDEKAAGNYVRLQHMLRLLLTGVVLLLGALVPAISLWGTAAGVLSFQLSIYVLNFKQPQ